MNTEYRIQNTGEGREMCEGSVCQAFFFVFKHLIFTRMAHFMNFKN